MNHSKNVITDKIEMVDTELGWQVVQVREAHIILEDGVEISESLNVTQSILRMIGQATPPMFRQFAR